MDTSLHAIINCCKAGLHLVLFWLNTNGQSRNRSTPALPKSPNMTTHITNKKPLVQAVRNSDHHLETWITSGNALYQLLLCSSSGGYPHPSSSSCCGTRLCIFSPLGIQSSSFLPLPFYSNNLVR